MITFENRDCVEAMKEFPDQYFDLAIVDPPYGDALGSEEVNWNRFGQMFDRYKHPKEEKSVERRGGQWATKYGEHIVEWDVAPKQEYFEELFRVSKNQIIWGGNYFSLPPTRCFIAWVKTQIPESFTMAMCEYAWASFNANAKVLKCNSQGDPNDPRFHPTQKPVYLYMKCLSWFAQKGDKILDTHVGSGSSLIACERMGLDVWGYEIDETYFKMTNERLERVLAQGTLF